MDEYIRDYKPDKIETNIATNIKQCEDLLGKDSSNDFRLYHNNIRSLSKNIDELKTFARSVPVSV